MKMSFKFRVYAAYPNYITHGKYSYKLNIWSKEIMRCKAGDEQKMYIDHEGIQSFAWEMVESLDEFDIITFKEWLYEKH